MNGLQQWFNIPTSDIATASPQRWLHPPRCPPQTKWLPASRTACSRKSHRNCITKAWWNWGTRWRRITPRSHPGEEEGGTYRLPWRPTPDAVYAIVAPGTSFVIPPDPNQLVIISGTNSVTLGNLRRNHAEAAREFKEWVNLESAQGKSKSRRQLAKHFSPEYLVVMGIRPSPGEGHRRTPLHGVQTGGKPRPRQKSLEVVGAVGREQTIPGISATGPGNPRVRERRRADNRRRRYCRHSLHARVQHGPDLRRLRQVGRQATWRKYKRKQKSS